jgi:hypothetical protein
LILLIPSIAYSDTLTYSPQSSDLTIPAGESREINLNVFFTDDDGIQITGSRFYYMRFMGTVEGDLPAEWISASPRTSWRVPASTTIKISVPEDAEPGEYSGTISSFGMGGGHGADNPGYSVNVLVPSVCSGEPEFEIHSAGPEVIWPPNYSIREFTIEGRVILPEGCELYEFGYGIEDEYDEYTGMGEVWVDMNGEFSIDIPVEASRLGSDKDGRHYSITIIARDMEDNIAISDPIEAVVPHDRR